MANEATITLALTYADAANNIPSQTFAPVPFSVTVAGAAYARKIVTVTTSKAALPIDSITPGYCLIHNTDPTNYVSIFMNGTDAGSLRLKAGESQLVRFDSAATPNAQANTASCKVEFLLLAN